MRSKYKIIFGCVIFNLILEYWVHGIFYFFNPLSIFLILLYLTYFFMLEDLILRFHFKDYQVLMVGFIFGVYTEIFTTGSIFGSGYFFGIDPFYFFIATVFWWGIIQGILTMYFSNRFFAIRDWADEEMGKIGWILAFSFHVFMFLGFLFDQNQPTGNLTDYLTSLISPKRNSIGYITSAIILIIVVIIYFIIQKIRSNNSSKDVIVFEKSKFLDSLTVSYVIISLVLGTILFGNILAQILFVYWSIINGIIFIIYRIKIKKSISV